MAKCKIQINSLGDITEACELADVKILETKPIGEAILAIISYRNPSQLFWLGVYSQSLIKTKK